MEDVYAVWVWRRDGVLEQMTDEEGMPVEMPSLQAAQAKAVEAVKESHVQKVYIRQTYTVEILVPRVKP